MLAITALALLTPLTVVVDGIDSDAGGSLYVTVQTEEQFRREAQVTGAQEAATAETMTFEFEVPAGAYVVSVWHDEEDNGVFDRKSDGWPDDGWGMSGDGGYSFDDGKVVIGESPRTVAIDVIYPE